MLSRSGLTKMSISLVARGWAWTLTAQPPIIRYLTLQARKADRRSQKLPSNFSFIAALLEEGKAEFLHGHQPLDRRPALPVGIFLILGLQESFRVVLEDTHGRFTCFGHETSPPRGSCQLASLPSPARTLSPYRKHRRRW